MDCCLLGLGDKFSITDFLLEEEEIAVDTDDVAIDGEALASYGVAAGDKEDAGSSWFGILLPSVSYSL